MFLSFVCLFEVFALILRMVSARDTMDCIWPVLSAIFPKPEPQVWQTVRLSGCLLAEQMMSCVCEDRNLAKTY